MSKKPINVARRGFFASAASVGAVVAGAAVIPGARQETDAPPRPLPTRGGGYQLSEHVKRYYKTTLV